MRLARFILLISIGTISLASCRWKNSRVKVFHMEGKQMVINAIPAGESGTILVSAVSADNLTFPRCLILKINEKKILEKRTLPHENAGCGPILEIDGKYTVKAGNSLIFLNENLHFLRKIPLPGIIPAENGDIMDTYREGLSYLSMDTSGNIHLNILKFNEGIKSIDTNLKTDDLFPALEWMSDGRIVIAFIDNDSLMVVEFDTSGNPLWEYSTYLLDEGSIPTRIRHLMEIPPGELLILIDMMKNMNLHSRILMLGSNGEIRGDYSTDDHEVAFHIAHTNGKILSYGRGYQEDGKPFTWVRIFDKKLNPGSRNIFNKELGNGVILNLKNSPVIVGTCEEFQDVCMLELDEQLLQ